MFAIPSNLKIHLAIEPADMRRHYDGLWALAERQLGENPLEGALFVFANKARNRLKMLYWDGSGVWVFSKRLERGRFNWPRARDAQTRLTLEPAALTMLLAGIDLKDTRRRDWHRR
jgi:transposase